MRIEVLGAGGAHPVPRPFCNCPSCTEARTNGAPYTRYCPSLFIHDLGMVIDTPEESGVQLNRAGIARVEAALYSHWHPDHTAGSRVFEANYDPDISWEVNPKRYCTTVFIPQRVADTFSQYHDLTTRLSYLERAGVITRHFIPAGESVTWRGCTITPFLLAEDYVCGFILESNNRRVLICMDELNNWQPDPALGSFDLTIMPAGVFEFDPLTNQRRIPADHPILIREATYAETLDMLRAIDTKRVVFMHLNHSDQLTYEQFRQLGVRMTEQSNAHPIYEFAYDGMLIEL